MHIHCMCVEADINFRYCSDIVMSLATYMLYSPIADWCPAYGGTTVYIAKDEDEEVSECFVVYFL